MKGEADETSLSEELELARRQAELYGRDVAALFKAERKRRQELEAERNALRIAQSRLHRLLEFSPAMIYACAPEGHGAMSFMSENVQAQLGYPASSFTADPTFWISRVHPDDLSRSPADVASLKSGKNSFEYRFLHADGSYRWMIDHVTLQPATEGRHSILLGFWMDVTRDRRMRDIRREMLSLLAHELNTPMAVLLGMERLLETSTGEFRAEILAAIRSNLERLHHTITDVLSIAEIRAGGLASNSGEVSIPALLQQLAERNSVRFSPKNIRCEVCADPALPPVPGDVRLLERALYELLDNASTYAPQNSTIMLEAYADGDSTVIAVEDDGPGIDDRDRQKIFEEFTQSENVFTRRHEGLGLGLPLVRRIAETHNGTAVAEAPRRLKGARLVLSLPRANEQQDARAEIQRLQLELAESQKQNLAFASDLAKTYAAERHNTHALMKTKEQLERSAKLATLGEMVAAIAHDVGNMISPIGGYADLLAMNPDLPENCKKYTRRIQESTTRAATMLRSLTDFGRRSEGRAPVHIGDVIKEAYELLEYNLSRKGVRVVMNIESPLPSVHADAGQIEQVLINLMVNAQHAMDPNGGEMRIEAKNIKDCIRVSVTDKGCGIPENVMKRIFEPFFTTKEKGKGTGLGLFICHQIIDSHGGAMEVQSAPGNGSEFSFTLPALPPKKKETP
ncbi:MAG TPA: ATP-binding protein [Planctomycetota bacterium]|nr:ATP-binding protein [Planctomycetota bacterium]